MPVNPTPTPTPTPTARRKTARDWDALPKAKPSAAERSPRLTVARGFQRATPQPDTGPSTAPATQISVMVEAVAARVPPNSVRRGGKKTGNALVIPVTSSAEAKARRSRPLTRLSRLSLTTRLWLDSLHRSATHREPGRAAARAASPGRQRPPAPGERD